MNDYQVPEEYLDFNNTNLLIEDTTLLFGEDFKHWSLPDFINNMKSWPNLESQTFAQGQGRQEVLAHMQEHYKLLSLWLDRYLLHNYELDSRLYSEPYVFMKPQADLSAKLHDFISREFYPRLGHIWGELAPTPDHLWVLLEYSLCYQQAKKILDGTEIRSKTKLLGSLKQTIDILRGEKHPPGLIDAISLDGSKKQKRNALYKHFQEIKEKFNADPLPNLWRLVDLQIHCLMIDRDWFSDQPIDHSINNRDWDLSRAYKEHLDSWDTYRKEVSRPDVYQVMYLTSPHEPPQYSRKGQKPKGFDPNPQEKRGRGRPPKGQKTKKI